MFTLKKWHPSYDSANIPKFWKETIETYPLLQTNILVHYINSCHTRSFIQRFVTVYHDRLPLHSPLFNKLRDILSCTVIFLKNFPFNLIIFDLVVLIVVGYKCSSAIDDGIYMVEQNEVLILNKEYDTRAECWSPM
jgi:hypothetical protein